MKNAFLSVYSKLFSILNSRYVNRFVPVPRSYITGKNILTDEKEKKAFKLLEDTGKNIEKLVENFPIIKELNEVLFIQVLDMENLKLTGVVRNGTAKAQIGWDTSETPSFVLPLYYKNLENVFNITKDLNLSLEDIYRIVRVLFIPFLKGLYQGDYSHLPKDKSYLQLDNFIHVEVMPYNNIEVDRFPGTAQATVVNVDGQWLVFEGLQGDPDIKYTMDLHTALQFAYLVRVKLQQQGKILQWDDLKDVVVEYNKLKAKVISYERDWH